MSNRVSESTMVLVLRLEKMHGCDLGVYREGWHCFTHGPTCESIRGGSLIVLPEATP